MSKTPAKPYQPTERETATLALHERRRQVSKASPRWKVIHNDDGPTEVALDHVDLGTASKLLMENLGTVSGDFVKGLMEQIAILSRTDGQVSQGQLNFMLAFINGMEPRNEAEAMLALQMATVHSATVAAAAEHATDFKPPIYNIWKEANRAERVVESPYGAIAA